MAKTLGDEGVIDLLDFTAELTIYTSSATLIGPAFRDALTPRVLAQVLRARSRHRRDRLPATRSVDIEAFRVRDRARERLVELVGHVIEERQAAGRAAARSARHPALAEGRRHAALLDQRDHRHPRLDHVRGPPHQRGHRRLDAGRAAARAGPDEARGRGARPHLRRRPRGVAPGAARDPAPRERGEGGAAPASAADLAAAHRARGLPVPGLRGAEGHDRGDVDARSRTRTRTASPSRSASTRIASRRRARKTPSIRGPTCPSAAAATAASARTSR